MTRYSLGWKRQAPDPRDHVYLVRPTVTAALPASVDLSPGMGELLDQGDLGSCGPNTADECIEFDEKAQSLPLTSASRLYVYWNTRYVMGEGEGNPSKYLNEDSGVDNRSMLKALSKYGFVKESLWPYDTSKFKTQPPQSVYDQAQVINSYAAVANDLAQMKGCLATGRPFVFGFDCFEQIMSDQCAKTGIIADPAGQLAGGHDVTICGYDDAGFGKIPGGAFKIRNHWAGWGDPLGYGYISYAYATGSHASDFWVINAIPTDVNPQPIPQPSPTPGPRPSPCRPGIRAVVAAFRAGRDEFQKAGGGGFIDWLNQYCGNVVV